MKENNYGLLDRDISNLLNTFEKFEEVEKAVIFGSRAMGNYKESSDIDLAIFGKNVSSEALSEIDSLLNEELPIPFFIDIVYFETITNNELKEHIQTEGKIIYKKTH